MDKPIIGHFSFCLFIDKDIEFIYFYLQFKNNEIGTSFVNSFDVAVNKPVKIKKYLESISTCTRPVDTKHVKVVTYREGFH